MEIAEHEQVVVGVLITNVVLWELTVRTGGGYGAKPLANFAYRWLWWLPSVAIAGLGVLLVLFTETQKVLGVLGIILAAGALLLSPAKSDEKKSRLSTEAEDDLRYWRRVAVNCLAIVLIVIAANL